MKSYRSSLLSIPDNVAPLVGAWIEISAICHCITPFSVAPLVGAWIEILNSQPHALSPYVAPLVGAWIEICYHRRYTTSDYFVAPLVGAWIEIIVTPRTQSDGWSLPLWERGLKFALHPPFARL